MRSLVVAMCCLAVTLWMPDHVTAAICEPICETTELWGYSGESLKFAPCQCTQTTGAARSGPNCQCNVCYVRQDGKVFGYAKDGASGQCKNGANCDDCDIASTATPVPKPNATATTAPTTSTTSPATNRPSTTTLTPSSSAAASGNSSSTSGGNLGAPPSNSSDSNATKKTTDGDNNGLETWQIALIICSAVLVVAVVMMTITSCYCKARNRMKDNIVLEEETREYENYWHPGNGDDRGGGNQLTNSGIGGSLAQGGRGSFNSTHSRPNSTKNLAYSEPTYATDDRIGPPTWTTRQSLGSNADLPGVYQPFQSRERPSHEVGSRKNIAIEL